MEHLDERQLHESNGMEEGEFIPGLPNDIVLQHIAIKISLKELYALIYVNRKWRRAIRSREIYTLRAAKGVTLKKVVAFVKRSAFNMGFMDVDTQDFYFFSVPGFTDSRKKKEFSHPIPTRCSPDDEIDAAQGIVFLDGKLYALRQNVGRGHEVMVLDLGACETDWKVCSSYVMHERSPIWMVCNGKVHAFHTCEGRLHGVAFDPSSNEWREIEDRPVNVCHDPAFTNTNPKYMNRSYLRRECCGMAVLKKEIYLAYTSGAEMMVFDSVTERWRTVPDTMLIEEERRAVPFNCFELAVIDDKLYSFTRLGVEGYTGNTVGRSWTVLQPSFNEDFDFYFHDVATVAASGRELVALLESDCSSPDGSFQFPDGSSKRFCRSKGFGVEGATLVWETVPDFCLKRCLNGDTDLVLDHVEV